MSAFSGEGRVGMSGTRDIMLSLDCKNKQCEDGKTMSFGMHSRAWLPMGTCPDCKGTGKLPELKLKKEEDERG